jgi:glycosyltransferase involved in cell wall biosynthesis
MFQPAESRERDPRPRQRILACLPLPYSEEGGFWNRDLGLIVRKLRVMGHDAWLVALKKPGHEPHPDSPVIVGSLAELEDPAWWRLQRPDAIILTAWGALPWHALRRAVAALGVPLVEKLDTDGVKSSRIWFWNTLMQRAEPELLTASLLQKGTAAATGLARTLVAHYVPSALYSPMVRSMSLVPAFAAETPVATARVKRFLRIYHASPMPRVVTIPHPANTDWMRGVPSEAKENIIIAVGRWHVIKKGFPFLLETAKRFLKIRPDWKIVVVGQKPTLKARMQREMEAMDRFSLVGSLDHKELSSWYQRAKIYFLPSYWESFNIAATEALCCGCSVVGPSKMASVNYFTSFQSGTPSHVRSPDHMTDALLAEVDEWEAGHREPEKIAQTALQIFSAETVAEEFLKVFDELKAS